MDHADATLVVAAEAPGVQEIVSIDREVLAGDAAW